MKKHLKLLSVLGITSLLLTGCKFIDPSSSNQSDKSSASGTTSSSPSSNPSDKESSSKELKKFTITWKNYDGTILETDENVLEGVTPTYDGLTPVKASDEQYNYVWSGWNPTVEPAKANTVYTATFTQELRKYTVVWKNYDGTVLETDNDVPYGTTPSYNSNDPTKESTAQFTYTFDGWDPAISEVKGDATYTAKFKEETRKYTITWKNDDGTVIKTEEVPYGETPTYTGDTPTKDSTSHYSYTFDGWSPNVTEVTGDAEYVATYKEVVRTYTITWVNYDGTILEVDENVEYGVTPTYNSANPTRANERGINYTWRGWSPTIVPVYRDATYTAKYSSTGYFSFDLINYELQPGYQASDLKGAPWVNVNVQGELNKIKKPSIKDDFYTGVNYDPIKNKELGSFEISQANADSALQALYYGETNTTNGNFYKSCYSKMKNGDLDTIKSYLSSINIDTYLGSKESFIAPSSYLKIDPVENGYEVYFNDGYIRGNTGLNTLLLYRASYSEFTTPTNNLYAALTNTFDISLSSSDRNNIYTFEANLSVLAYNSVYSVGSEAFTTYTVNELPWEKMKAALLDMGLASNTSIIIREYCKDSINYLYNTFYANYPELLLKSLMIKLGFDNRFMTGVSAYSNLNNYIKDTGIFSSENSITAYGESYLKKEMLRLAMMNAYEQCYIELQGSDEVKNTVSNLIEDVLKGYQDMISEMSWLSQTARDNILRKLSAMTYASCYSDQYKNLGKIDDSNLNSTSLSNLYRRYLSTLLTDAVNGNSEDPNSWAWDTMASSTVNAFYTGAYNSFVILNGLVSGFLGDTVEELYGMLGFVIGHEITHAFDSNGSHYDEHGQYNDLLTSADRTNYDNRVNKLINFFDSITLLPGTNAGGSRVNGEAIADMGGIKVMLQLAKKIPNFNYDAFFRACAKTWRTQPYDDYGVQARLEDEHPFAYLRVNVTLAQFDEFVETYDLGPGDGMYIPENQRIKIW